MIQNKEQSTGQQRQDQSMIFTNTILGELRGQLQLSVFK